MRICPDGSFRAIDSTWASMAGSATVASRLMAARRTSSCSSPAILISQSVAHRFQEFQADLSPIADVPGDRDGTRAERSIIDKASNPRRFNFPFRRQGFEPRLVKTFHALGEAHIADWDNHFRRRQSALRSRRDEDSLTRIGIDGRLGP